MLRTEELLAAHRVDGAEQYFARAVDFGFSFSVDETYERWHREKILEDSSTEFAQSGPTSSSASCGTTPRAAASIARPRRPSRPRHFAPRVTQEVSRADCCRAEAVAGLEVLLHGWLRAVGELGDPDDICRVDGNEFDPLLGRTYNELGGEARSMHMCQGMPQLYSLPGPQSRAYVLEDSVLTIPKADQNKDLFAGIDTGLRSLARYGKGGSPALGPAIEALEGQMRTRRSRRDQGSRRGPISTPQVLTTVRALRAQLGNMQPEASAREEAGFRLEQKERQAEEALRLASGLRVDLLADDGLVVGAAEDEGDAAGVFRRAQGVAVKAVEFTGVEGTAACTAAPIEGLKPTPARRRSASRRRRS